MSSTAPRGWPAAGGSAPRPSPLAGGGRGQREQRDEGRPGEEPPRGDPHPRRRAVEEGGPRERAETAVGPLGGAASHCIIEAGNTAGRDGRRAAHGRLALNPVEVGSPTCAGCCPSPGVTSRAEESKGGGSTRSSLSIHRDVPRVGRHRERAQLPGHVRPSASSDGRHRLHGFLAARLPGGA